MSFNEVYIFQTEIAKTTIRVSELKTGVQSGLLNSGIISNFKPQYLGNLIG